MREPPSPDFRWGLLPRRSQYNRVVGESGEVELIEGSTHRQEIALSNYIKSNNLGRVVAVYKDVASAYSENAKRPEFENALLDLQAGRIDGIAIWKIDRLVRSTSQFDRVLGVLRESGGRLLSMVKASTRPPRA